MAAADPVAVKPESFCQATNIFKADAVRASQNLFINLSGFHRPNLARPHADDNRLGRSGQTRERGVKRPSSLGQGKDDSEGGAVVELSLVLEETAMLFHDPGGDGQAQA